MNKFLKNSAIIVSIGAILFIGLVSVKDYFRSTDLKGAPPLEILETSCNDAIDNDADGKVDCEDFDCLNATACNSPIQTQICGSIENPQRRFECKTRIWDKGIIKLIISNNQMSLEAEGSIDTMGKLEEGLGTYCNSSTPPNNFSFDPISNLNAPPLFNLADYIKGYATFDCRELDEGTCNANLDDCYWLPPGLEPREACFNRVPLIYEPVDRILDKGLIINETNPPNECSMTRFVLASVETFLKYCENTPLDFTLSPLNHPPVFQTPFEESISAECINSEQCAAPEVGFNCPRRLLNTADAIIFCESFPECDWIDPDDACSSVAPTSKQECFDRALDAGRPVYDEDEPLIPSFQASIEVFLKAFDNGEIPGLCTTEVSVTCDNQRDENTNETCNDKVDNDCNGYVDCDDTACSETSICKTGEACNDSIDNDCDTLIDCNDLLACSNDAACRPQGGRGGNADAPSGHGGGGGGGPRPSATTTSLEATLESFCPNGNQTVAIAKALPRTEIAKKNFSKESFWDITYKIDFPKVGLIDGSPVTRYEYDQNKQTVTQITPLPKERILKTITQTLDKKGRPTRATKTILGTNGKPLWIEETTYTYDPLGGTIEKIMKTRSQEGDYTLSLEIDGMKTYFKEISGIESETEIIQYDDDMTQRKRPGLTNYSNITLKRGGGSMNELELLEWYKKVVKGVTERKSGSVIVLDRAGEEVMRYNFINASPTKWKGPALNSKGDTHIEELELSVEQMEPVINYEFDHLLKQRFGSIVSGISAVAQHIINEQILYGSLTITKGLFSQSGIIALDLVVVKPVDERLTPFHNNYRPLLVLVPQTKTGDVPQNLQTLTPILEEYCNNTVVRPSAEQVAIIGGNNGQLRLDQKLTYQEAVVMITRIYQMFYRKGPTTLEGSIKFARNEGIVTALDVDPHREVSILEGLKMLLNVIHQRSQYHKNKWEDEVYTDASKERIVDKSMLEKIKDVHTPLTRAMAIEIALNAIQTKDGFKNFTLDELFQSEKFAEEFKRYLLTSGTPAETLRASAPASTPTAPLHLAVLNKLTTANPYLKLENFSVDSYNRYVYGLQRLYSEFSMLNEDITKEEYEQLKEDFEIYQKTKGEQKKWLPSNF